MAHISNQKHPAQDPTEADDRFVVQNQHQLAILTDSSDGVWRAGDVAICVPVVPGDAGWFVGVHMRRGVEEYSLWSGDEMVLGEAETPPIGKGTAKQSLVISRQRPRTGRPSA